MKKLVSMIVAVSVFGGMVSHASDLVVRALPTKSPINMTHVDEMKMYIDPDFNPVIRVEGRQCLQVVDSEFCDFIEQDYLLPTENIKTEVVSLGKDKSVVEVQLHSKDQAELIGEVDLPEHDFRKVVLSNNVVLFFDKPNNVPAILYIAKKIYPFRMQVKMDKFKKLHKDLF